MTYGDAKLYYIKFLRREMKKTYTMYLPANSPLPGTYEQVSTTINTISDLKIRNYPIRVKCNVWVEDKEDYLVSTNPRFRVYSSDSKGDTIASLIRGISISSV